MLSNKDEIGRHLEGAGFKDLTFRLKTVNIISLIESHFSDFLSDLRLGSTTPLRLTDISVLDFYCTKVAFDAPNCFFIGKYPNPLGCI